MIRAVQLCRDYRMGDSIVHALDHVDVTIETGDFVSIVGASGSGKSTLMHLMGCLDRPTSGTLEIEGKNVARMTERMLAALRNKHIGFVFQSFNLINRTSAIENVCVPLIYTRKPFKRSQAMTALERVGLRARAKHSPSQLSGGECQRVAIARAIVNSPSLILADEPTGNLDSRTSQQIMDIFRELHSEGMTIVIVTHEMDIAAQARRIIRMKDGRIAEDNLVNDVERSELLMGTGRTEINLPFRRPAV